jgi:RNA polymerase sigma factor (sigma-70 family)
MGVTDRFEHVYAAHVRAVLGYALRRTPDPEDAADVVAETFLVALRRLDEVPAEPGTRPWLYAVARRTLANQHRGHHRRHRLGERLRHDLRSGLGGTVPDPADDVAMTADARRALDALSDRDREVLELALWEGLEPREIAEVLGVSPAAARQRLSRARAAVRGTDILTPAEETR